MTPHFKPSAMSSCATSVTGVRSAHAVCVNVAGRPVVDLWGGFADYGTRRPWGRDTLLLVWSCTKAAVAMCAGLANHGKLDLDIPVARYWPEFAQSGKDAIPVRWLDHQAGLPAIRQRLATGDLYDWRTMTERLAAEAPFWPPGTRVGYHAATSGTLSANWCAGWMAVMSAFFPERRSRGRSASASGRLGAAGRSGGPSHSHNPGGSAPARRASLAVLPSHP